MDFNSNYVNSKISKNLNTQKNKTNEIDFNFDLIDKQIGNLKVTDHDNSKIVTNSNFDFKF